MAAVTDTSGSEADAGGVESQHRSRTILWCVPRSVSTALTKCLSAIEDNQVWFEPFLFCKISAVGALDEMQLRVPTEYEGNEEVYQQAVNLFDVICNCKANPEYLSFASIKRFLESSTSQHVFVKDMAFAIGKEDMKFIPKGYKHTFLIRHPLRVFNSFRKAIFTQLSSLGLLTGEAADEKNFDIGRDYPYMDPSGLCFKDSFAIWKYVRENFDSDPIVIDGDDLLTNPAKLLPKYCRAVGLPYDESLLKWDASLDMPRKWMFPADELIEKFVAVYERAVTSSEFLPASKMPSRDEVTPDVIRCTDEVMKYYEEMYETRMQI